MGQGAEEDDVHALGAAQGHGNIRSLQGKDLEGVLHGLQASGRILELTGGDGSRGDLIVIDDGHTLGLQEVGVAYRLHLFKGHHIIRPTVADEGRIHLLAPADLGGDGAAPLAHTVNLGHFHIITGPHQANAYQENAFYFAHDLTPFSKSRPPGKPERRRCSPRTESGRWCSCRPSCRLPGSPPSGTSYSRCTCPYPPRTGRCHA